MISMHYLFLSNMGRGRRRALEELDNFTYLFLFLKIGMQKAGGKSLHVSFAYNT